jgi:diacylglycerol kinase (ATP)
MPAKIILNPYSNRWKARERWPLAEQALRAAGFDFELQVSEGPGFITKLAEKAALEGFSPIVAAGGDGTIGEVVNGLVRAAGSPDAPLATLGIFPLGTANDFSEHAIGLPLDLNAAAKILAAGKVRKIDLGQVNERYFINNTALGLEPYITQIQSKIGWIKGVPRYLLAAVRGILDRPAWNAEIEWGERQLQRPDFAGLYWQRWAQWGSFLYVSECKSIGWQVDDCVWLPRQSSGHVPATAQGDEIRFGKLRRKPGRA